MKNGICVLTFMQTTENSVRSACSLDAKINEIRLLFNTPKLEGRILVIVEGLTDKVYKNLFDNSKVVFKKNGSCDGLISFIDKLNVDFQGLYIVIKDADFDHLNNISYTQYDNVFLTDTHDIETMMLSVRTIEQKLAVEFLDEIDEGFIQKCMKHLEPLSYLKWYNISKHLNLVVKEIQIGTIYDGCNQVSLTDCEYELYKDKKNRDRCACVVKEVSEFIKTHKTEDKWNLVNGHDLCKALNIFFKNQGKSTGDVSKCLRMGYSLNDFKQTELYHSINKWENLYRKKILKDGCQ